jgi:hypothetical protein
MPENTFPLTMCQINYLDKVEQREKETYHDLVNALLEIIPIDCHKVVRDNLKFVSEEYGYRKTYKIYYFLLTINGYRNIKIAISSNLDFRWIRIESMCVRKFLRWEVFTGEDMFARALVFANKF